MVERLFLAVPRGCLLFVIVVFPDHTHLLFLMQYNVISSKIPCAGSIIVLYTVKPVSNRTMARLNISVMVLDHLDNR